MISEEKKAELNFRAEEIKTLAIRNTQTIRGAIFWVCSEVDKRDGEALAEDYLLKFEEGMALSEVCFFAAVCEDKKKEMQG